MAETFVELVARISADASELKKALAESEKGVEKFGATTDKETLSLSDAWKSYGKIIAVVGAAVIGTLTTMVVSFAKVGSELKDLSLKTGISVEALAGLKYAAEQSGASLGTVEMAIKRVAVVMSDASDGTGEATKTFDKLGLSLKDLQGLSPEQQFLKIAGAIAEVPDPMQRAAIAVDLFGRSGTDLLPMLSAGSVGLKRMMEEGVKLTGWTKEGATKADDLGDAFGTLKASTMGLFNAVAESLAPAIKDATLSLANLTDQTARAFREAANYRKTLNDSFTPQKELTAELERGRNAFESYIKNQIGARDSSTKTTISIEEFTKNAKAQRVAIAEGTWALNGITYQTQLFSDAEIEAAEVLGILIKRLDPEFVKAQEDAAKASAKLIREQEELQKVQESLNQTFNDFWNRLIYGETEAGKYGLTIDDVYKYMRNLGYGVDEVRRIFDMYGTDTAAVQEILDRFGWKAQDVAKLIDKLSDVTKEATATQDKFTDSIDKTSKVAKKTEDALTSLISKGMGSYAAVQGLEGGERQTAILAYQQAKLEVTKQIMATTPGISSEVATRQAAALTNPNYLAAGGIIEYQRGGLVENTGLAYLHEGERVIPEGNAGGIVINFTQPVFFDREDTMNRFVDMISKGIDRKYRLGGRSLA